MNRFQLVAVEQGGVVVADLHHDEQVEQVGLE
jgi:hypothetical protein